MRHTRLRFLPGDAFTLDGHLRKKSRQFLSRSELLPILRCVRRGRRSVARLLPESRIEVKTVEIHYLVPGSHEVIDELLP